MPGPPETGEAGASGEATACMACGRPLRDRESRRLRLGPRCLKRLKAALERRPRRLIGTHTAITHPKAVPSRPSQLALEIWDDDEPDEDDDPYRPRSMTDVPTGTLL
ncbi:DUF6011 domain-containing protein [Streptomyces sp. NPDC006872]|uniref:DUF6011 domain-containing protein n=1 Tax=Streptomyces sp. NPDC006872 TaxID=3155720 RepID=UPI00340B21A7